MDSEGKGEGERQMTYKCYTDFWGLLHESLPTGRSQFHESWQLLCTVVHEQRTTTLVSFCFN